MDIRNLTEIGLYPLTVNLAYVSRETLGRSTGNGANVLGVNSIAGSLSAAARELTSIF